MNGCCYYNESDPRTCVPSVDMCGKHTCHPNVATFGGKVIAFMITLLVLVPMLMFGFGDEAERGDEEKQRLLSGGTLGFMKGWD